MSTITNKQEFLKDYFKDRTVLIATMHQKEQVIAPLVDEYIGLKCKVPQDINTDALGSFTREIERKDDVVTTLKRKCDLVSKNYPEAIVMASEGSFGQHPHFFFSPADEEMIMFKDPINDIEIIGKHLTTETNFQSGFVQTKSELNQFLENAMYPSHGVTLRADPDHTDDILKDLNSVEAMNKAFDELTRKHGNVYAETDMRACQNPTRMKAIKLATENLFKNLSEICDHCLTPGISVQNINPGLPCELCSSPTKSTLSLDWKCKKCGYEKTSMYPFNKEKESAQFCDYCNP